MLARKLMKNVTGGLVGVDPYILPHDATQNFGTGNFFIRMWAKLGTTADAYDALYGKGAAVAAGTYSLYSYRPLFNGVVNSLSFNQSGTNIFLNVDGLVVDNQWVFVEVSRSAGTLSLYTHGVLRAQQLGNATDITGGTFSLGVGQDGAGGLHMAPGKVAGFEFGSVAGNTSNYTPGTPPV